MKASIIAWTDNTFNAGMGCTKVSAGCANCYAETLTKNRMGLNLWGANATRQITKQPWKDVLSWQTKAQKGVMGVLGEGKPQLVFTGSLMDWAEDRADLVSVRNQMWDVIKKCDHLHFQMLTKRPENIVKFLPKDWGSEGYPNVWLGTSVEDMRVSERADILREIPAVVRFISYEPALGSLNDLDLKGIDWVIFGGESGSGFRRANLDWAREMKAKCENDDVAYFFKQSSAFRTEQGIELDGEIVRKFPIPRIPTPAAK
jgi:protein gp37